MDERTFEGLAAAGSAWLPDCTDTTLVRYARFLVDQLFETRSTIALKIKELNAIEGPIDDEVEIEHCLDLLEYDREIESMKCIIDIVLSECIRRGLSNQLKYLGIENVVINK